MSHDDTAPTPDGAAPHGCDGDLPTLLVDQIEFHMREQVRPRLEGLTDEEYFYDPTGDGDIWTVHPRAPEGGTAPTSIQGGAGETVIDFEFPEPTPPRSPPSPGVSDTSSWACSPGAATPTSAGRPRTT